jgi:Na+/H+ antiporter NhaC
MNKWLKVILVVVLLALVVILLYSFSQKNKQTATNNNQQQETTKAKPTSYSLNGKVTAISGHTYTLLLANGKITKLFRAMENIDIVKRSIVNGNLVFTPVKLDQIKVGSEVVVNNTTDPANQGELVDVIRVEIIK